MLLCFIRHRPYHPYCLLPRFLLPRRRNSKYAASATTAGIGFVVPNIPRSSLEHVQPDRSGFLESKIQDRHPHARDIRGALLKCRRGVLTRRVEFCAFLWGFLPICIVSVAESSASRDWISSRAVDSFRSKPLSSSRCRLASCPLRSPRRCGTDAKSDRSRAPGRSHPAASSTSHC